MIQPNHPAAIGIASSTPAEDDASYVGSLGLPIGVPERFIAEIAPGLLSPGITDWAQIRISNMLACSRTQEKSLTAISIYIKKMSLTLDLLIVFQSVTRVLLGGGSR